MINTVCLDCGKKYKTKEKEAFGVWWGDCDICGGKEVACAAAGHDFGIYERPTASILNQYKLGKLIFDQVSKDSKMYICQEPYLLMREDILVLCEAVKIN